MLKRVLIFIVVLLYALPLSAGTKRALVIGLGQQADLHWSMVHGDRDVELVKKMLNGCGFTDIDVLINEQATKENIVSGFKDLQKRAERGDVIYIHFSGHGQQVTDLNGDEDDGWDESWIPYDAYMNYCDEDQGEKHLVDDEIAALLQELRLAVGEESVIAVVVDACHSGDSTRGNDFSKTQRGVFTKFILPASHQNNDSPRTFHENWLTLSACKEYQVNFEHPNGYGKLTYLIYSYRNAFLGMSNDDFIKALDSYMKKKEIQGKYPQSPVLSGDLKKYRFTNVFRVDL